MLDVHPVDLADGGHHQVTDDGKRTAGRRARNHADYGRRESEHDEQGAYHQVREARTRASRCAGRGFHERGLRARAEEAAEDGADGVDGEDGLDIVDVTALVQEVTLLADGHNRAHRVEEVAHQQGEY